MKTALISTLLIVSLGCDDKPPTGPPPVQPGKQIIIDAGYTTYLDSLYFKQWSDSSWEKYEGWISHEGVNYVVTLNSGGTRYYYSTFGYAGFKPIAEPDIIFFEQPLGSLPDTMTCGQIYTRETNFYYQGHTYHISFQTSLYDTVSISVPVGTFSSCLWMKSTGIISANNQSDTQTEYGWIAHGPAEIRRVSNSGDTTVMAYGNVNDHWWGTYPEDPLRYSEELRWTHLASPVIPTYIQAAIVVNPVVFIAN